MGIVLRYQKPSALSTRLSSAIDRRSPEPRLALSEVSSRHRSPLPDRADQETQLGSAAPRPSAGSPLEAAAECPPATTLLRRAPSPSIGIVPGQWGAGPSLLFPLPHCCSPLPAHLRQIEHQSTGKRGIVVGASHSSSSHSASSHVVWKRASHAGNSRSSRPRTKVESGWPAAVAAAITCRRRATGTTIPSVLPERRRISR